MSVSFNETFVLTFSYAPVYTFLTMFSRGPKQQQKRVNNNYRRCIEKLQLKERSGAGLSKLPVCRYYKQLRLLHNTVSSDETNYNVDIKFAQRASPNIQSKVIRGEGSGNVPVIHEVTPPEKNRKLGPYRKKPMVRKLKQTREEISITDLMIKEQ